MTLYKLKLLGKLTNCKKFSVNYQSLFNVLHLPKNKHSFNGIHRNEPASLNAWITKNKLKQMQL